MEGIQIGTNVKVICTVDNYSDSGIIKKVFNQKDYLVYGYSFIDADGRKGSAIFTTKDIEQGITKIEIVG